jgi:hypothetical protein
MMMFRNFFKSQKDKDLENLHKRYSDGLITKDEYKSLLHTLDEAAWYSMLSDKEKNTIMVNKAFNRGEITIEEYKEKIKDLDHDKWVSLLSEPEKILYDLSQSLRNGEITSHEYEKQLKTHRKEAHISVLNVNYDDEGAYVEFDWNSYFIDELKESGYTGLTDEEIVDKWFSALCTTIAAESETVIVTNPDDLRKVRKNKDEKKSEFY